MGRGQAQALFGEGPIELEIRFHPAAYTELLEAQAWYDERSTEAAKSFASEVEWALDKIAEAPDRWRQYVSGTRRYLMPNFPFSVIYRVNDSHIEIVALAHHRRRPGYWRKRQ